MRKQTPCEKWQELLEGNTQEKLCQTCTNYKTCGVPAMAKRLDLLTIKQSYN